MPTIELIGRITEDGQLDVQLPNGLPVGEVVIRIELPLPAAIATPAQVEPHSDPDNSTAVFAPTAKPSKNEDLGVAGWHQSQRRRTARQNADTNEYRLKWIRYKTQQRKKSYRRSLNREKS